MEHISDVSTEAEGSLSPVSIKTSADTIEETNHTVIENVRKTESLKDGAKN